MQYQSPHRRPQPKKKRTLLVVIIVVVVLAAIAAAIVLASRLGGSPAGRSSAGDAYVTEAPTAALRVAAPEAMGADSLRGYFDEAVAYAKAGGLNTLIFEGRQGLTVLWEDDAFPLLPTASAAGIDPLGILCEAAKGQELEIWVSLPPYAGGGYSSETKGEAVDLAKKLGDPTTFEAGHADYQKLLAQSLGGLAQTYPVAGVVLTGLDASVNQTGFTDDLAAVKAQLGNAALVLDTENSVALTPEQWADYVAQGQADRLITTVDAGAGVAERLAAYGNAADSLVLDERAADATGAVLFSAAQNASFSGAVYAGWPEAGDSAHIGFLKSTLAEATGELPAGFDIPQTLQVNYPLDFDAIGTDQSTVFVMGNSDPGLPLLLDGGEITRISTDGSFGVAVELLPGENNFTFSQGDTEVIHTITRPEPAPATDGGDDDGDDGDDGDTTPEVQNDNTREAEPGQAVQVTGVFTGALSDPNDESAINETYYGGAVAVVQESFETWRYDTDLGRTVKTWAYRLTSGDWVAARNCSWIDGDGQSAFTGLAAGEDERGEWITFEGEGTPAATISCRDNLLSVTLYDTSFTLPAGFTSQYVKSASVEEIEDGVRLELQVEGIWGYQIDYSEGTRLFLKSAPTLSDDAAAPLAGVRVLLDPGHGDTDIGAPGIMGGAQTPNEKDVNLAQAQAIAYRLRQLGAEVTMVREGDDYSTVSERLALQIEQKPDFFLSVHHNSAELTGDRNTATGLQAYYHIPDAYSAPLSQLYAANLMDGIGAATGRKATVVSEGYFTVTRTPVCPSVLFEYGFMVNPADFSDFTSAEGLYAAACGTAEGIYNTVAGVTLASAPDEAASSSIAGGENSAAGS